MSKLYQRFSRVFKLSGFKVFVAICLLMVMLVPVTSSSLAGTIPTTSIVDVVKDTSVTIRTYNFPANQTFTVRIGPFGTLGINGTVVASTASGAGGSFVVTYSIPAGLKGSSMLSIRLQSPQGYYAYDWFYNTNGNTPTSNPVTPYTGIPTTSIVTVVKDTSVTIKTYNFPKNQNFTVRMGYFGTAGIKGTVVATTNSGAGGSFDVTYTIPAGLKGQSKLAIRLDSPQGYYAYDWFYNTNGNVATPTPTPSPTSTYTGIPTTTILSVVKDTSVTLQTNNFPAHQTFTVRMGAYGTYGVNGTVVGTTDSGAGGTFNVTYTIPAGLKGLARIAIRLESTQGYYAYDWFYNN